MKVVIRADASNDMGIGHVMRCLALADEFTYQKADVSFISRLLPGHVIELVRQRGYPVYTLPAPAQDRIVPSPGSHQHWLGCSQTEDANQCMPILQQLAPDWLIVDHYALDESWHQQVRHCQKHLMVIDDLADRKHDCDLLLDQNWFSTATASRYDNLVPAHCVKLLGPAYALLKPEFGTLRKLLPERDGQVGRVLISMGGGDPTNETLKAVQALMAADLRHLLLDVVCGVNHHDMPSLQAAAAERGNTNLYRSLPSLAGLMARADLMIGAGGTTTWERMCLGLPAIVISTAQNQYLPNLNLAHDGYIFFAGKDSEVSVQSLQHLIRSVIIDKKACQQQSFAGQNLVTGSGVVQVIRTLIHINNSE
jgi:UDP-2,4-diacetamido-2,4,6-trideoxy-beta-L-altropyranose hydrolase